MPKFRRSMFILSEACVDCHAARRDSSGCVDAVSWQSECFADEAVGVDAREERRASYIPGAEGAPPVVELVLLVEVAWLEGGTMRRD